MRRRFADDAVEHRPDRVHLADERGQRGAPGDQDAEAGGRGTTTITFNVPRDSAGAITGGGTVTFGIQLNGFPANTAVNLAHIHPGASGVNGGVLVNTGLSAAAPFVLGGDGTGNRSITVDISQADATNIAATPANFYFNVHTTLNPSPGAARGQLVRQ